MAEASQQTEALLRLLDDAGIPFVLIGGVAAITWEENVTRLLHALAPYRPRHFTRQDLPGIRRSAHAYDRELWIIALDDLIAVEEHVARPKDLIVAAQLRAIRATLPES